MKNKTLHYQLSENEWLKAWDELKPAEIKVLFYLKAINPFGDRKLSFSVTSLAAKLKISKSTASRALKRLNILKYISLSFEAEVLPTDNSVLPTDNSVLPTDNSLLPTDNSLLPTDNKRPLKPALEEVSKPSQTLKTLKTLKDFLLKACAIEPKQTKTDFASLNPEPEPAALDPVDAPPLASGSETVRQVGEDQFSAPANFSQPQEIHPTEKCDRLFQPLLWGSYQHPELGFLEFLAKTYLPFVDHYNKFASITLNQAKKWLLKARQDEHRFDSAVLLYEDYQEARRRREESERLRATPAPAPTAPPPQSAPKLSIEEIRRIKAEVEARRRREKEAGRGHAQPA